MDDATSPTLTCAECAAPLVRKAGRGKPPTYCSGCRKDRERRAGRRRYLARTEGVVIRQEDRRAKPVEYQMGGLFGVCANCGETFERSRKGVKPKTCQACRRRAATVYHREWSRSKAGPTLSVNCADCGVRVQRRSLSGSPPKRCEPCRLAAKRRQVAESHRRASRAATEFTCVDCRVTGPRPKIDGPLPKRCTDCQSARTRARNAARQREATLRRYESVGRWSRCVGCGATIKLARKGVPTRRCPDCRRIHLRERYWAEKATNKPFACPDCGTWVVPDSPKGRMLRCRPCARRRQRAVIAEWKASHPEYRRNLWSRKKYRRRARMTGADSESFNPTEIYERDRWTCGICRKRINRKLRYPDPMCASLDHVVPLSEGGPHTRANTRASHLRCNITRQHYGGGEQLALIG